MSCADGRFINAVHEKEKADLVDQALAVEQHVELPDLPADCSKREYSGVKVGMRLDEAALRSDVALTRANARVKRCAKWYESTKAAFDSQPEPTPAPPPSPRATIVRLFDRDQPQ